MTMTSVNLSHKEPWTTDDKLLPTVSLITRKKIQLLLLLRFSDDGCLLSKLREECSILYNQDVLPFCSLEILRQLFRDMERCEEPEFRLDENDKGRPFLKAYAVSQKEAKAITQQLFTRETSTYSEFGDELMAKDSIEQLDALAINQLIGLRVFSDDTHTAYNVTLPESSGSCTKDLSNKLTGELVDYISTEALSSCVNDLGQRRLDTELRNAVDSVGSLSTLGPDATGSIFENNYDANSVGLTDKTIESDYLRIKKTVANEKTQVTDYAVYEDVSSGKNKETAGFSLIEDIGSSATNERVADSAASRDKGFSANTERATDSAVRGDICLSANNESAADSAVSGVISNSANIERTVDTAVSGDIGDSAIIERVIDTAVSGGIGSSANNERNADSPARWNVGSSENNQGAADSRGNEHTGSFVQNAEGAADSAVDKGIVSTENNNSNEIARVYAFVDESTPRMFTFRPFKSRDTRLRKAQKRITSLPSIQDKKIPKLCLKTLSSRPTSSFCNFRTSISSLNFGNRVSNGHGCKTSIVGNLTCMGLASEYNQFFHLLATNQDAPLQEDVPLLLGNKPATKVNGSSPTFTLDSGHAEFYRLMESCDLLGTIKAKHKRIQKPKKNKLPFSNPIKSFSYWSCCPSGSSDSVGAAQHTYFIRTKGDSCQPVYKWIPFEHGGCWQEVRDLYLPRNTIVFGELLQSESGPSVFHVIDAARVHGKNMLDSRFESRKREWCKLLKQINRAKLACFIVTMDNFAINHLSSYLESFIQTGRVTLQEKEVLVKPSHISGVPTVVIKEILFRYSNPPRASTTFKSIMSSMRCWEWNLNGEIKSELLDCRETAVLYEILIKYSKT